MKFLKTFTSRLNFYILSLTVFIFFCLGIVFYIYISKKETENAYRITTSLVEYISLNFNLELQLIQEAVEKTSFKVFEHRKHPDMMMPVIKDMVARTDTIYGGGVAYEPYNLSSEDEFLMEYAYWDDDTVFVSKHMKEGDLDYLDKSWFADAISAREGRWSEPYVNELDQQTVMISYSLSVIDEDGKAFAVVLAELALKDLTKDLERLNPYDNNYSFIIAKDGTYLSHPKQDYILNETIFSVSDSKKDQVIENLGRKILTERKGTEIVRIDGRKYLVSYSEIRTLDCVVCCMTPYASILEDFGRLTLYVLLILCVGLLCLTGCMHIIVSRESQPVDIMAQDLAVAHKIQEKMLPDVSEINNIVDRVDLYAYLRPARDVGGDMYDFFVDNEKLFFAIGDVSGKGVPSALIMSVTKSFFRSCSKGKEKAEDVVRNMNSSIMENDISDMFITLFVGILDLKKYELSYCNAGHEMPLIFTQRKTPVFLNEARNFPIGIMKDCDYSGGVISFRPKDKIVIYTDGVTEAENGRGEYLGTDAVIETLVMTGETSAHNTVESLLSLIDGHSGGKGQSDDITMMCIKMLK